MINERFDARGSVRVQVMLNGFQAIFEHDLTFHGIRLTEFD
jgi:hypothetical protein